MNDETTNFGPAGSPEDAALDALLRQAAWPEPSTASTARLRGHWLKLRRRRPAARLMLWSGIGAAAAATVLLFMLHHNSPPVAVPPTELTRVELVPEQQPRVLTASSRPPTLLEAAIIRRAMSRAPAAPPAPRPTLDAVIAKMIDAHAGSAETYVEDSLAALRVREPNAGQLEEALAGAVRNAQDERRRAAAVLLSAAATKRSLPLLWKLATEPLTHDVAMKALRRIADPQEVDAFEHWQAKLAIRRQATALAARTSNSVNLKTVLLPAPDEAPAAKALEPLDPQAQALFGQLASRDAMARVEAARKLGRLADAEIVSRLTWMAETNVNRREAMTALASSTLPEAQTFLEQATRSPALAGAARTALLQARMP